MLKKAKSLLKVLNNYKKLNWLKLNNKKKKLETNYKKILYFKKLCVKKPNYLK